MTSEQTDSTEKRTSLQASASTARSLRQRLPLRKELLLALLPTLIVLAVFGLVEVFSRQRLLFASLASSAFLIYLDPEHGTNTVRTLVFSHLTAMICGFATYLAFGPGYLAGGSAMVIAIVLMVVFDVIHPPAVSTALGFAFRAGAEQNLVLFALALMLVVMLVLLQRAMLWLFVRLQNHKIAAR